jgi:predicted DNA binding CopG/RHH family protein
MTNLICFTQDVPGERDFINSHFPQHINLETNSSGNWPAKMPTEGSSDKNFLYEIAYSDYFSHQQLLDLNLPTYKLFYKKNPSTNVLDNRHWVYADHLLHNFDFQEFRDELDPYFQVLHVARSGTVFTESILSKKYKKINHHHGVSCEDNVNAAWIDTLDINKKVTVALVYNEDIWRVLTSTKIANTYGFHHHYSVIDWENLEPLVLTNKDMLDFQSMLISSFNWFCNTRSCLPTHNFYLLEGSNLINKYSKYTTHSKINYDKKKLISNYNEAKQEFETHFQKNLQLITFRMKNHLTAMKCRTNIDNLNLHESI